MDLYLAAIITGVFALLVAFTTHWLQERKNNQHKQNLTNVRVGIVGHWEGEIFEYDGGKNISPYSVKVEVSTRGKVVVGKVLTDMAVNCEKPVPTVFLIRGGQYQDRIFRFDYENENQEIFHFGAMILRVNATAKKMEGTFCGYGAYTETILSGKIELNKIT